jgi:hypothetical protein
MTADGGLARWEVMNMTNIQRKNWINLMTERAKRMKEAREKGSTGSRNPPRGPG